MRKTTITVNVDTEILEGLRKLAEARKKGFLGKIISEALKRYLEDRRVERIRKEALVTLEGGFHMGKLKIKERDELYDRK